MKIGVLRGQEKSFPETLIERINQKSQQQKLGITAEFAMLEGVRMAEPSGYRVLVDRISHEVPFFRAYLKNAMLNGAEVINDPFWWSADEKFFNYALAAKIGIPVPRTVLVPHFAHPPNTTSDSMRNMVYPINWEKIFNYVGFPAFLKPHSGGGWKHVYKVNNPEEFFKAYHQSGDLAMVLQEGIAFTEYYRCYTVGRQKVRIMWYDPSKPYLGGQYGADEGSINPALRDRITFRQLNLLDATLPFSEPFQLIFCRNVMIYFDRPTQDELVERLSRRLVPGGYLLVGHSESLTHLRHALRPIRPAVYQKPFGS